MTECTICRDVPIVPVRLIMKDARVMCPEVLCLTCWEDYCLRTLNNGGPIKSCLACKRDLQSVHTDKSHIEETYMRDLAMESILYSEAGSRVIKCPFCNEGFSVKESVQHRAACPKRLVYCSHKSCTHTDAREAIAEHESQCMYFMQICVLHRDAYYVKKNRLQRPPQELPSH